MSENKPAVKIDAILLCDIYWSYVTTERARRRLVMNTGDTKTVYVHTVCVCMRTYVCILKFCLPRMLFLKMHLKWISALEKT